MLLEFDLAKRGKWVFSKHFEAARNGIPAIEGLRGLAIALVFFVHYYQVLAPQFLAGQAMGAGAWMGAAGHSGVDLFFILSGYLIYGASLKPKIDLLSFWQRRIRRIYPAFLATSAVYVALALAFCLKSLPESLGAGLVYYFANLLFLTGFFTSIPALITVSWSMSYEVAYYLAAPILVITLRLCDWKRSSRVSLIIAIALGWLWICASGYSVHGRMAMFPAGMLLFELSSSGYRPYLSRYMRVGFLSLFIAGILLSGAFSFPILKQLQAVTGYAVEPIRVTILFLTLSPLVFCALHYSGSMISWLETPGLRYLGNMSYSYYLFHCLGIHFAARVLALDPKISGSVLYWLFLPIVFALTVIVSIPLYLLVEKPFSLAKDQPSAKLVRTAAASAVAAAHSG